MSSFPLEAISIVGTAKTGFEGLVVVDLSRGMAGQLAAMVLGDNGASVVKIEEPEGDRNRSQPGWQMWNRGKRSVALDLESESSQAELRRLVEGSDVVIEDFGPGLCPLESEFAVLVEESGLIVLSISSFGAGHQLSHLPLDDGVVMARSGRFLGLDHLSGAAIEDPGDRPVYVVPPLGSYGAAMLALQGIAGGLVYRNRVGRGITIETSLLDGVTAATMRLDWLRNGDEVAQGHAPANDLVHRGIMLTFLTAECSDGRHIQMCARQDHHFRNWLRALNLEECLSDPRFMGGPLGFRSLADIDDLETRIRKVMLTRTQQEWMHMFIEEYEVGADPFLMPHEFLQQADMLANDRIVTLHDSNLGSVTQVGKLVDFSVTPSVIDRSAPAVGESSPGSSKLEDCASRWAGQTPKVSGARSLPLDGVTILELAGFLAGPFGATLLAELGARVIKVEPLSGDAWRPVGVQFAQIVKGKESVAIDLKSAEGREILHALVEQVDVVVHNFRGHVPERLGFDYVTLKSIKEDLIYVNASSYGSRGPQKNRPAFHSTPNALCGGGVIQAGKGNIPVDDSYPDTCSGMAVGAAIAMALAIRSLHGAGQYLETTMLASTGYVHSNSLTMYSGAEIAIPDGAQSGLDAFHRLYETASGWLYVSCATNESQEGLLDFVGIGDWRSDDQISTAENRAKCDADLSARIGLGFAALDANACEKSLAQLDIVAVVASSESFEQFVVDSGLMTASSHPAFPDHWVFRQRVRFESIKPPNTYVCGLGEHTAAVLGELGYSGPQIREFADRGVIGIAGV
jgi:crotonobetainyl-CoA:carnitine CoA-transferase CaiB-like acyl-CoA transferase